MEAFTLQWADVRTLSPATAVAHGFPAGCGAVSYRLAPETKSSRSNKADVVCAYKTLSNFNLGRWFHRIRRLVGLGRDWTRDHRYIFCHADGTPWTSKYFREVYLYPALQAQQPGCPVLRTFDTRPGNTIRDKFWSLHCYRRGARTYSNLRHEPPMRRASTDQLYEHARWRRRRAGEKVDIMYREWTAADRVRLTYFSL